MLINILQCKGQPSTTNNYPTQNVSCVKVEKSRLSEDLHNVLTISSKHLVLAAIIIIIINYEV